MYSHPELLQRELDQPPVPSQEPNVTIMQVVDPEMQEAMRLIQVPDPDPFKDKLDANVGIVYRDSDHKVQCEECGKFLKNRRYRKIHVQC